jgi:hypothetical protein
MNEVYRLATPEMSLYLSWRSGLYGPIVVLVTLQRCKTHTIVAWRCVDVYRLEDSSEFLLTKGYSKSKIWHNYSGHLYVQFFADFEYPRN